MNANEARLRIHGAITEVLVEMLAEDGSTPEELEQMEDTMAELADILMEDIGLDVLSVDDDKTIHATLQLYTDLVGDEEA